MQYDIIVVGAGIAGLRVGIEVLRKGCSCILLERNQYVGGRIYTFHDTVPGVGRVQWEAGAGRIATSHKKVLRLLARYGLTTGPISDQVAYQGAPNRFTELLSVYLEPLRALPPSLLRSTTLGALCETVLGSERATAFLSHFPYDSEIHTLRADRALVSFDYELGSESGFVYCKEGLDRLMQGMQKEFVERGGILQLGCSVTRVSSVPNGVVVRTSEGSMRARGCVLAITANAMRDIRGFSLPVLDALAMRPLFRMYAVFPVSKGKSWFSDVPKVVTRDHLRYFIPIDASRGICMISYTDGQDAEYWMRQTGRPRKVMKHIRGLFPEKDIPEPLFFKEHLWKEGCTYWLPGDYDVAEESRTVMNPAKGIFVCGESFAEVQCWMECAVEHADAMMALPAFQQVTSNHRV